MHIHQIAVRSPGAFTLLKFLSNEDLSATLLTLISSEPDVEKAAPLSEFDLNAKLKIRSGPDLAQVVSTAVGVLIQTNQTRMVVKTVRETVY